MSRKDYIKIAKVLLANKANLELVDDFAQMLEADNPRFDWARFRQAAYYTE